VRAALPRATLLLVTLPVAALLAGCSGSAEVAVTSSVGGLPQCTPRAGTVSAGVLIMAQSVPTAGWLPCVRTIPVGWSFNEIDPQDGTTTFWLNSDRDGAKALAVLLRPTCDIGGGTEVPSEQPGMRRYERVTRVSQGYGGERHYVFAGGCVTYQFDLQGKTRAEPVAALSEALSFVSRADLARLVHDTSGGRLRLDAAGSTR
jgi:hypothetical protein